jgi:hypothetical protein
LPLLYWFILQASAMKKRSIAASLAVLAAVALPAVSHAQAAPTLSTLPSATEVGAVVVVPAGPALALMLPSLDGQPIAAPAPAGRLHAIADELVAGDTGTMLLVAVMLMLWIAGRRPQY